MATDHDHDFVTRLHQDIELVMRHMASKGNYSDYIVTITMEDIKRETCRKRAHKSTVATIAALVEKLGYGCVISEAGDSFTITAVSVFSYKQQSLKALVSRARLINELKLVD